MAVRTLTYWDLTQVQRARGAHKMREKLLGILSHPFVTPEQRTSIFDKIAMVDRWEHLKLDVPYIHPVPQVSALAAPPSPIAALPERTPQHHEVGLGEDIEADDKLS
jgi:hypothetical protein